jgi:hypothetical protein
MKFLRHTPAAVMVLAVLMAFTSYAQDSWTLKHNYLKGKSYRMVDSYASKMSLEVMGKEQIIPLNFGMQSHMTVENIQADGVMSIVSTLDSIKMDLDVPGAEAAASKVNELTGKRTRFIVTPNGELSKTEAIDSVSTQAMFGTFQSGRVFHFFPKTAVKIGDTWSYDQSTDGTSDDKSPMKTLTKLTYTLTHSMERNGLTILVITYTGNIKLEGETEQMNMKVAMEGEGTMKGTMSYDVKKGLVIDDESELEMSLAAAIAGQESMTIPITQSMTFKRVMTEM